MNADERDAGVEAEEVAYRRPKDGKSNLSFVVAMVVAAAAVIGVAFTSFDSQVYFYTVAEAQAKAPEIGDDEFRIKGNVVRGSHFLKKGSLDIHHFQLVDADKVVEVVFEGPLPDTFTDEAEVVALGHMAAPNLFVAEEVVAKCPSRYDAKAPTGIGGAQHPEGIPR